MARIIQKKSDLKQAYIKAKACAFFGYLIAALCFAGAVVTTLRTMFPVLLLFAVGVMAGIGFGGYSSQKAEIYRCGIVGENATAEIVRHLPNGYYVVQNVVVKYEGKLSELDLVVLGPTGVFVVETKYLKGNVVGNYAGDRWELHKVGRGGTSYSKTFYSPVKQVGTHVYRLANYLRKKGVNVWVEGMVCFSNPETELFLQGAPSKIPVFSVFEGDGVDLCNYITHREKELSDSQIQRILKMI